MFSILHTKLRKFGIGAWYRCRCGRARLSAWRRKPFCPRVPRCERVAAEALAHDGPLAIAIVRVVVRLVAVRLVYGWVMATPAAPERVQARCVIRV